MQPPAQPEILSPRVRKGRGLFDDENLDILSHLLDDFIKVPGTSIRFGLDGIVGLIPGIGDILGGLASSIIIVAAWARGVPYIILTRMVANIAIEVGIGAIPLLGDKGDAGAAYHIPVSPRTSPGTSARIPGLPATDAARRYTRMARSATSALACPPPISTA